MGPLRASVLALCLGALAALTLVSCGSGSSAKLLPGNTAGEITANLDKVKRLAQGGECVGAEVAAAQVSSQVDALGGVDKALKQALREGASRLNALVSRCGEETTEATETNETPTESTPGKAPKKEEKPKKPKPTQSEPPKTKTTKTTTTPTTPSTTPATPTTPTTEGTATNPPSGGVGPGSPAGGGR